jgi:hypothetical protein
LAGHEAARKDVDSLKNPDASDEEEQDAQDIQYDPHSVTAEVGDFVVIARKNTALFSRRIITDFQPCCPIQNDSIE